ncbi:unnamed protein product, partial [Polarella glacialis]
MEELAEIIRNPATKLQEWDQCISHNQMCRRLHGQKLTQGILHVLIAGSPCADYSKWGKVLQSAGPTTAFFLILMKSVLQSLPDVFVHENVTTFPMDHIVSFLGELYDITFSQIDPADDCGFPIHRKRVYLVAHRRAVVMRRYKDIGFPEYVRQVQIKSTHKLQVFLSAMTAGITTVTGSKMKRLLRYRELFSNRNVFDLNQSPDAIGLELLLAHGVPITEWAASALGNTAHCRMAGNSMHAAAVPNRITIGFLANPNFTYAFDDAFALRVFAKVQVSSILAALAMGGPTPTRGRSKSRTPKSAKSRCTPRSTAKTPQGRKSTRTAPSSVRSIGSAKSAGSARSASKGQIVPYKRSSTPTRSPSKAKSPRTKPVTPTLTKSPQFHGNTGSSKKRAASPASTSRKTRMVENLFQQAELDRLLSCAEARQGFLPSLQREGSGQFVADHRRTSLSCPMLWPLLCPEELVRNSGQAAVEEEFWAVLNITSRCAQVLGVAASRIEPLQLVRYTPGKFYAPHFDTHEEPHRASSHAGEQRSHTLL